ncbi:hypothetical protein ebA1852 [Aromatoleum aromaticum EbN1]|uniref:Uncharacterized protein n=1 Tax=Aromatoleum aromaticum (strain DSM 19018 / LMG 30748 / EbN1) TaxID=76114 RepID=Q5P6D3_AROAE|nr:hypothetical protein ebA1852 [Aromatoleum aromaticum EbN1]
MGAGARAETLYGCAARARANDDVQSRRSTPQCDRRTRCADGSAPGGAAQ